MQSLTDLTTDVHVLFVCACAKMSRGTNESIDMICFVSIEFLNWLCSFKRQFDLFPLIE